MIKETNKYRLKVDTPWMDKGFILESNNARELNAFKHPHLFDRLYEFENGDLKAFGDTVYKILTKGYNREIKNTIFAAPHTALSFDNLVFPTEELAQKRLMELEENDEIKKDDSEIRILLEQILHSSSKNIDKMTMGGITTEFEAINEKAERVLQLLKPNIK